MKSKFGKSNTLSRSLPQIVSAALFAWLVTNTSTFAASTAQSERPEILLADFEGPDYGDWKVTGEAFGTGPARGTLPNQMQVDGFLGKGLVNSFHKGDDATGTLSSPNFTIQRNYLQFLIGGGGSAGKTCLNLLLDGQVVRTAVGPNNQPGGSERLDWQAWDVRDLAGRSVSLQIVDDARGGWGHINIDHILQTDRKVPHTLAEVKREIQVESRYLNLPIKNGAPKRQMSVLVNGRAERQFEIELADAAPDWWAFLDLTPFHGKSVTLKVDQLREDSEGLKRVFQANTFPGEKELYKESLRPQFHFTSRRGWNNDPNGLVFYAGEYHLFYQHNPYGWNWGNMHWGHAVSKDLVHWKELPEALYPDQHGTMFSGSAVVDWNNTAGLQKGREKTLICIFTAAGKPFTQGIAFSNDRGRSWKKYAGNPVLPHIAAENRDPKVIWYAPAQKWVMALYLDKSDFALFESRNLKEWQRMSDVLLPGASECPEFFEIPVEGQKGETRWVFYGGNGRYLVGRFDGRKFTPDSGPHELNYGNCFYASQTYTDIPAKDGRRILVPWGQMATPGMPFNQMMGIPVELTLRHTGDGLQLAANPVKELTALRASSHRLPPSNLAPGINPLKDLRGELLDLSAEITPGTASTITLNLRGVPVVYDVQAQTLVCQGKKASLKPENGRIQLRLLVDRTSIDIFGNQGRLYMPMGVIIPADNQTLELSVKGGNATVHSLEVHQLKSAWIRK